MHGLMREGWKPPTTIALSRCVHRKDQKWHRTDPSSLLYPLLFAIFLSLPIRSCSVDFNLIKEAAKIKSRHPLSYADAFAVATALREDADIITGDPEFKGVEGLVSIEWL